MTSGFVHYLLETTQSSDFKELEVIQSLWSGYGKISRYELFDSPHKTVVIKHISLKISTHHPRGWNTEYSHQRKVKSYEVETNWYQNWQKHCTDESPVPNFIGSYEEGQDQWIILEDLNVHYPIRKQDLSFAEIKVCLKWLANFHATFMGQTPNDLWEVGTYWHLATRPDELEKMQHEGLKAKAHRIDELLNNCKYKTVVHGDAKPANFCFPENATQVAAVDFQYVGGGCGMKDVAYFLGASLTSDDCALYETELLDFYFVELKAALATASPNLDFNDLEKEWREMFPIAWTDFTRFLLGWMPTHRKVNGYSLRMMEEVLAEV